MKVPLWKEIRTRTISKYVLGRIQWREIEDFSIGCPVCAIWHDEWKLEQIDNLSHHYHGHLRGICSWSHFCSSWWNMFQRISWWFGCLQYRTSNLLIWTSNVVSIEMWKIRRYIGDISDTMFVIYCAYIERHTILSCPNDDQFFTPNSEWDKKIFPTIFHNKTRWDLLKVMFITLVSFERSELLCW